MTMSSSTYSFDNNLVNTYGMNSYFVKPSGNILPQDIGSNNVSSNNGLTLKEELSSESSPSSAASGYFSSPSFGDDLDFLNYPASENNGTPSVGSSSSSSYGCSTTTTTWNPTNALSQDDMAVVHHQHQQQHQPQHHHQISPHMHHQQQQQHQMHQQFHYNGDNNVNNYYQQQQYYCNASSDQNEVYSSHFQEQHHQSPESISVSTVVDPVYPSQQYLNQCQSSPFVQDNMPKVQQQSHADRSPRLMSLLASNTIIKEQHQQAHQQHQQQCKPNVKREKKSVKKRRDPNEPQKPVSAYALFFRDRQAMIKVGRPNASFGEISKIVASMWDQLDQDSKTGYKRRTEQAKKEYLKALAAYRASLISSKPLSLNSIQMPL